MEDGMNRFGEEARVLRTRIILRTREDYVNAFGLNVDGCKVFPNPKEEGICIKCPISGNGYQLYEAIFVEENASEGLYVMYPSWIDYRPYLERWKARNGWRSMSLSEIRDASRKARMEEEGDRAFSVLELIAKACYPIALTVCPALIITAVLTGHSWLACLSIVLSAIACGVLIGSADFGPRSRPIAGLIALVEMPVSLLLGVALWAGMI